MRTSSSWAASTRTQVVVAEPLVEAGGVLDVGEEQGDDAVGAARLHDLRALGVGPGLEVVDRALQQPGEAAPAHPVGGPAGGADDAAHHPLRRRPGGPGLERGGEVGLELIRALALRGELRALPRHDHAEGERDQRQHDAEDDERDGHGSTGYEPPVTDSSASSRSSSSPE